MAEQSERPRPHGDPIGGEVVEPNPAQRQSDAPGDAVSGDRRDDVTGTSDRSDGRGSTANGLPAFDEDEGEMRKKQYESGADLISRID